MRTPRPALRLKLFSMLPLALCALADPAAASSRYDGVWNLQFVSRYGPCDPTYNFTVDIHNGFVSHPNLVRFTGHVGRSGAVHASVIAGAKSAAGSGRLSAATGQGRWSGHSGMAACGGTWTAQRN